MTVPPEYLLIAEARLRAVEDFDPPSAAKMFNHDYFDFTIGGEIEPAQKARDANAIRRLLIKSNTPVGTLVYRRDQKQRTRLGRYSSGQWRKSGDTHQWSGTAKNEGWFC